jgi:hypothetical protein
MLVIAPNKELDPVTLRTLAIIRDLAEQISYNLDDLVLVEEESDLWRIPLSQPPSPEKVKEINRLVHEEMVCSTVTRFSVLCLFNERRNDISFYGQRNRDLLLTLLYSRALKSSGFEKGPWMLRMRT